MVQAVTNDTRWQRKFFTIWTGQAFSLLGSNVVQFALVWWLTTSTGSATVLATATLFAMLPQILFAPFAGTLVDRWNRRIVMIGADSFIALSTLVLALLFATGSVQVWHVYVVMLLRSAAGAFHGPAMQASTTLMVPQKHYARVAGINQALQGSMNIVGPILGALLLAALPLQGVLMIDVVTALIAVVPLLFITVPQPTRTIEATPEGQAAPKSSFWQEFAAGFTYVRSWPGLLLLLGMAMILNFLLSPAFSLLPLVVTKVFEQGKEALAAVNALEGIGIVAGGVLLGVWGGFSRRIVTSIVGVMGIGVGALLIGLAPQSAFALVLVGTFLAGFMQVFANGPLMAIMQATIAPEMQGRVFSMTGSLSMLMMPVSLLVAGPLADRFGVQIWYVIAGVVFVVLPVVMYFVPAVRDIEENGKRMAAGASAPTAEPLASEGLAAQGSPAAR